MKKAVYLFPIAEYNEGFSLPQELLFSLGRQDPYMVLNQCLKKRYRDNNYQIYFVNYSDTTLYKIDLMPEDTIITTEISLQTIKNSSEQSPEDSSSWLYPDFEKILDEIGPAEELVVMGYHSNDCVKKLANAALKRNIDTWIDMDLTEMFFHLYYQKDYFNIEEYSSHRFEVFSVANLRLHGENNAEAKFLSTYDSPAFEFGPNRKQRKKPEEEDYPFWYGSR